MKKLLLTTAICCMGLTTISLNAQKLSIGVLNGINFSNPSGKFTSGKWDVKQGISSGLFVQYKFLPWLSVGTELSYVNINNRYQGYVYKNPVYNPNPYPIPLNAEKADQALISSTSFFPSNMIYYPVYPNWEETEFSFVRTPVYLKFSTSTKLKFEFGIGAYVGFRTQYNYNASYSNLYNDNLKTNSYIDVYPYPYPIPYTYKPDVPKHDFGYLYSAGLSYPIANNFSIHLNTTYYAGRRKFLKNFNGTLNGTEINFGISYTGLIKKGNDSGSDESGDNKNHFYLTPKIGFYSSQTAETKNKSKYKPISNITEGISLRYQVSEIFSIQTELLFQRNGYRLIDSSIYYYRYKPSDYGYKLNTQTNIDYAVIPLLMSLNFGEKYKFYLNTGPYCAMLLNARVTGESWTLNEYPGSYNYIKTNVYNDLQGYFKDNDWGWIFGAGLKIPVFKGLMLDIEARYNHGFNNIYRNPDMYSNENISFKNDSYSITIGLQIPIK